MTCCGNITSMKEGIEYILARHADGTEERESAWHRLREVGPGQLRPIWSPLQPDWEEHFPEEAAAVQAPEAGLSTVESPQPEQVGDALSEEIPVDVGS